MPSPPKSKTKTTLRGLQQIIGQNAWLLGDHFYICELSMAGAMVIPHFPIWDFVMDLLG